MANYEQLLNGYVYDFLKKRGYLQSAQLFIEECKELPKVLEKPVEPTDNSCSSSDKTISPTLESLPSIKLPIDVPHSYLAEWWEIFWDMHSVVSGKHVNAGVPQASEDVRSYVRHQNQRPASGLAGKMNGKRDSIQIEGSNSLSAGGGGGGGAKRVRLTINNNNNPGDRSPQSAALVAKYAIPEDTNAIASEPSPTNNHNQQAVSSFSSSTPAMAIPASGSVPPTIPRGPGVHVSPTGSLKLSDNYAGFLSKSRKMVTDHNGNTQTTTASQALAQYHQQLALSQQQNPLVTSPPGMQPTPDNASQAGSVHIPNSGTYQQPKISVSAQQPKAVPTQAVTQPQPPPLQTSVTVPVVGNGGVSVAGGFQNNPQRFLSPPPPGPVAGHPPSAGQVAGHPSVMASPMVANAGLQNPSEAARRASMSAQLALPQNSMPIGMHGQLQRVGSVGPQGFGYHQQSPGIGMRAPPPPQHQLQQQQQQQQHQQIGLQFSAAGNPTAMLGINPNDANSVAAAAAAAAATSGLGTRNYNHAVMAYLQQHGQLIPQQIRMPQQQQQQQQQQQPVDLMAAAGQLQQKQQQPATPSTTSTQQQPPVNGNTKKGGNSKAKGKRVTKKAAAKQQQQQQQTVNNNQSEGMSTFKPPPTNSVSPAMANTKASGVEETNAFSALLTQKANQAATLPLQQLGTTEGLDFSSAFGQPLAGLDSANMDMAITDWLSGAVGGEAGDALSLLGMGGDDKSGGGLAGFMMGNGGQTSNK